MPMSNSSHWSENGFVAEKNSKLDWSFVSQVDKYAVDAPASFEVSNKKMKISESNNVETCLFDPIIHSGKQDAYCYTH